MPVAFFSYCSLFFYKIKFTSVRRRGAATPAAFHKGKNIIYLCLQGICT